MTPTWLTEAIAADLPLWVGAMARHPRVPGQHLVVEVTPGGAVWTRSDDGRGVESRSFLLGDLPAPDLDHRPTRLEFLARLALRLGAPADAVNEGVTAGFAGGGMWSFGAGRQWTTVPSSDTSAWLARWCRPVFRGTNDLNTALVRAWAAATKETP